jgi:hypothetical protein
MAGWLPWLAGWRACPPARCQPPAPLPLPPVHLHTARSPFPGLQTVETLLKGLPGKLSILKSATGVTLTTSSGQSGIKVGPSGRRRGTLQADDLACRLPACTS